MRSPVRPAGHFVVLAVVVALLTPSGAWASAMATPPHASESVAAPENSPCGTPVSPGPILAPKDGTLYAAEVSISAATSSEFGLDQPTHQAIISDTRFGVLGPDLLVGTFTAGTPLVFYIYTPYFGTTHLSTSQYGQMRPDGPDAWLLCFEDAEDLPGNSDYDEPVVRISYGVKGEVEPAPPLMGPRENGTNAGDPVQTFAGAFTYRHTDVAITGAGPSPTFVRSYDSADTRVGPLGPGWTHNYNLRVRSPDGVTDDVLIVWADGNTDRYTANPDGTYSPPPAVTRALTRGAGGSYVVTDKTRTAWTFNSSGDLVSVADLGAIVGSISRLGYDPDGRLISISDTTYQGGSPVGRGSLTLAYDASGLLSTITDWASPPRSVTYGYDAQGRLSSVLDREGATTTYGYDGSSARLTSITDARLNTALTLTYDATGRVTSQRDAAGLLSGNQTTFAYDLRPDGSQTTTVTYPATSFEPGFQPTIADTYTAAGWITERVSRPRSTETLTETYAYDTLGNRTSTTDPAGNTTNYCYDTDYAGTPVAGSRGNLTRLIGPSPSPGAARPVTLTMYDAFDRPTQTIAPKGVAAGTGVSCATDLSSALNLTFASDYGWDPYYPNRELITTTTRFTDPTLGLRTALTRIDYDYNLEPSAIYRPRAMDPSEPFYYQPSEVRTYWSDHTLRSVRKAGGMNWYFYQDTVGRRTGIANPAGSSFQSFEYDREDRLRFQRDPAPIYGGAAIVTEHRYDAVGNEVVAIDPAGQVTKFVYDERDALSEVRENPNPWTDPDVEPPGTIVTRYAYDAAGYLTRMTRAAGDGSAERVTDYVYDGRGLLRRETEYPAWPTTTPTLARTYAYDPDGRLATSVDPSGQQTSYGYDALGRLTSIDYGDPATADVTYGYDANGNRTSMTDGSGTTTYAYDEMNRLITVAAPGGTVGYRYDLNGNRSKVIYPDGTAVSYAYDPADHLTSASDWAARTTAYTYTADDLIATITNVDGSVATNTYDNDRRLTQIVHRRNATLIDRRTYTLDLLSNVTAVTSGSQTGLISTTAAGIPGLGASTDPDVSGAGRYVAFASAASNLVTGDTNGAMDVFLRDRQTNATTRVSTTSAGAQTNGASDQPSISGDGRYVTFRSTATNLVTSDTNAKADIFVKDTQTGATTRVSVSTSGAQATNNSDSPGLSSDGRYVVFASLAANLVTSDTNAKADIFVRDRQANTTTRVSVSTSGAQVNNTSEAPDISADGSRVVFSSTATNLVSGDTNAKRDVFLRNRATNTTTRLSVSSTGVQANNVSERPGISADGSTVAFESTATNLVVQQTFGYRAAFVRRIANSTTEAVSITDWGDVRDGLAPVVSATGTVVGFGSTSNMTVDDSNAVADVFVRDTTAATTRLASKGTLGETGSGASSTPALSADGAVVVFASLASEFVPGDTNAAADIFTSISLGDSSTYVYDRLSRLTASVEPIVGATTYTYDPAGNRLTKVRGSSTAYTYDRADRITSAGGVAVTVNAVGNLTARGSDTYAYDGANRLTSATMAGATETYAYDGDGTRVTRTVGANPAIPYVNDVNTSLPALLSDGTQKFVYGRGLAYAVSGSTVEVYHVDRLGSVRAITDTAGAVTATYRSDAFGVQTAATGTSTQPFAFTGEPRDATGLSYLRARYYEPSLGRFMSRDTWAGAGWVPSSGHRFVYVGNNPTRYTDPSGRVCVEALVLAGGGPPGAVAGVGITLGCALILSVVAAGAAWATGSALGQATGPLIDQIRADPTHVEWTPPTYNQPPAPRLPNGDPGNPDPLGPLRGVFAAIGVSVLISVVASALFGWDVHLGEPLVEPKEPTGPRPGSGKSHVLQGGP